MGNILLLGDLNRRISNQVEIYTEEFLENETKVVSHEMKRFSQDLIHNSESYKLMEIINCNNLVIANGRKFGELTRDFPCIKYNGCSVVDFCILL